MNDDLPTANEFRHRIMREDDLLNTRTTVFLITNGLLLTAVGISSDFIIRLIVSILGTIITICWIICSWQNWKVIKYLTIEYRNKYRNNYIENIVQSAMFKPGWRRPTNIIAKLLPNSFLLTWIAILVLHTISIFNEVQ